MSDNRPISNGEYDRIVDMIRRHVATEIIARETGRSEITIRRMRSALKLGVYFPSSGLNSGEYLSSPVQTGTSSL